MAEFLNRELRINESTAELARIAEEARARAASIPRGPQFQTLPDGRVLTRQGALVYDPKPQQ